MSETTAAKKGFRQPKKPTKKAIEQENVKLNDAVTNMAQVFGQQIYQLSQELQRLGKESTALANLLRQDEVTTTLQDGDNVMIDCDGVLDETGEIFDGAFLLGSLIRLGSGNFIAGFEKALLNRNIGDKFQVKVTFPTPYHSKDLEGKAATFDVKILKAWRDVEGNSDIETLHIERAEALKAKQEAATTTTTTEEASTAEAPEAKPVQEQANEQA